MGLSYYVAPSSLEKEDVLYPCGMNQLAPSDLAYMNSYEHLIPHHPFNADLSQLFEMIRLSIHEGPTTQAGSSSSSSSYLRGQESPFQPYSPSPNSNSLGLGLGHASSSPTTTHQPFSTTNPFLNVSGTSSIEQYSAPSLPSPTTNPFLSNDPLGSSNIEQYGSHMQSPSSPSLRLPKHLYDVGNSNNSGNSTLQTPPFHELGWSFHGHHHHPYNIVPDVYPTDFSPPTIPPYYFNKQLGDSPSYESTVLSTEIKRRYYVEGRRSLLKTPNINSSSSSNNNNSSSSSSSGNSFGELSKSKIKGKKFSSLLEVRGHIVEVAKDQHGCRFLQWKIDEGNLQDIEMIFEEIIVDIVELMVDPYANYLMQKLLENCNENQHTRILDAVSNKNDLVQISMNLHGTRVVQKLVETLCTPQQMLQLISILRDGALDLIKDINGNHVIHRCLQHLKGNYNQFIFDATTSHCVDIASHAQGCCVFQRCFECASPNQKHCLILEVISNVVALSEDQYGNYVVQYVIEVLRMPWATEEVIVKLKGKFLNLSMQKFSSNVVEKCIKYAANESSKSIIVGELVKSDCFGQLAQHPFANYVIQRALKSTKGALRDSIMKALRPHVHELRTTPYGKGVLACIHLKK